MNKKGFTLIEVLIVVVIIAVLASLILPRFMGQTERAVIAEAQQQLGAMRRGELTWMDMLGTTGTSAVTLCGFAPACTQAQWSAIGMTAPGIGTGSYNYSCAGGSCIATRAANPAGNAWIGATITLNISTGAITCGTYTALGGGRGCTA